MLFVSKKFLQKKYGRIFHIFLITMVVSIMYFLGTNSYLMHISFSILYKIDSYIAGSADFCQNFAERIKSQFVSAQEYQKRIIALEEELTQTKSSLADLEFTKLENQRLKSLLNFTTTFHAEKISSKLFGINNLGYGSFGMINAGAKFGVVKNSIVISSKGLIGRTVDIFEEYSTVLLLTDQKSKVPVVSLKSGQKGIFIGNNSNNGIVLYVEDPTLLEIGEILVTAGDGSWFLEGIPVAKISKINHDVIYADPLAVGQNGDYVSVIIRK